VRYFLTGRLPAITRVLLIESGRREIEAALGRCLDAPGDPPKQELFVI
jgi:hypothetical protein